MARKERSPRVENPHEEERDLNGKKVGKQWKRAEEWARRRRLKRGEVRLKG